MDARRGSRNESSCLCFLFFTKSLKNCCHRAGTSGIQPGGNHFCLPFFFQTNFFCPISSFVRGVFFSKIQIFTFFPLIFILLHVLFKRFTLHLCSSPFLHFSRSLFQFSLQPFFNHFSILTSTIFQFSLQSFFALQPIQIFTLHARFFNSDALQPFFDIFKLDSHVVD